MGPFILATSALLAAALLFVLYRRFTRISIRHVPGPPSTSFWLGNLAEYFQNQVGEMDFKWMDLYGDIVRIKAPFGEDRLLIFDPKAIQYILHTSGYGFPRPPEVKELGRIVFGQGIVVSDGADHRRHRKVLVPGFGATETRAFFPIFSKSAEYLSQKWEEMIMTSSEKSAVVNIPPWASRAMLDAMGEAAFDYNFGAMENTGNELYNAYSNLVADTFGAASRSNGALFIQNVVAYLPKGVLNFVMTYTPSLSMKHVRHAERVATDVARNLVQQKSQEQLEGKGKRDVMSLLVRANASEDPRTKLSDRELYDEMRIIMLAGHETTANSLTWTLYELALHPEMQHRLREEIRDKQRELAGSEIGPSDFDSMPYLTAVTKETLRYHPVATNIQRISGADDVLPLANPITLTTGETIQHLPIAKGTRVLLSITGYNRRKDVFGEDAQEFNPDRWLQKSPATVNLGVYANLLTFSAGVFACTGHRFGVLELQTFLVELIHKFEFAPSPELLKLRRVPRGVMIPLIDGQKEDGPRLPLIVKPVASHK